jgi:hypothetical protein
MRFIISPCTIIRATPASQDIKTRCVCQAAACIYTERLTSAGIAYLIMRWTFSEKRHAKLLYRYTDINVTVNSGAIVLLSLGLAFVFGDISGVRSRAKLAILQEADAIRPHVAY